MPRISLLETAHRIVGAYLVGGSVAIDATLGNGHDLLFLAQAVGERGRVFGFDIQQPAVVSSYRRLLRHDLQRRATLRLASHADMHLKIPEVFRGQIKAVMFNLGYLPGADKAIITQIHSTLSALNAALSLLAPQAVITVLAYPGHQGGDSETRALEDWCNRLDKSIFNVETIFSSHPQATAPRLFVIRK